MPTERQAASNAPRLPRAGDTSARVLEIRAGEQNAGEGQRVSLAFSS